jgi:hypothetical protein
MIANKKRHIPPKKKPPTLKSSSLGPSVFSIGFVLWLLSFPRRRRGRRGLQNDIINGTGGKVQHFSDRDNIRHLLQTGKDLKFGTSPYEIFMTVIQTAGIVSENLGMGFLEDFFDALGEDRTVNVAPHLILGKVFSKEYSHSRKLGNHPVQNVL